MPPLSQSIEAILFVTAEPQRIKALAERLNVSEEEIRNALEDLQKSFEGHGITIVIHDEEAILVTRAEHSSLLESMRKEELSKELSKASAETLSIILYWPGVSKAEIEFIRGVNASYTIRSLMMRGLIETKGNGRAVTYHPTISSLEHFGVTHLEDLPQYMEIKGKLEVLMKEQPL